MTSAGTSKSDGRPPRLAERVGKALTRRERWAETVLGDLQEEYAGRTARQSRLRARFWYWSQIVRLALDVALGRLRAGVATAMSAFFGGKRPLSSMRSELTFAARSLIRQPLLSAAIVLTMALGLGVDAAAFSMLNVLVLRPFPFPDVDRLAVIAEQSPSIEYTQESVSLANFFDLKAQTSASFDSLTAFDNWDTNLTGGAQPERVRGFKTTSDFFTVFRVQPQLGRLLAARDQEPGHDRVLVLSDALWRRGFGEDRDIAGRRVRLDGDTYEIVGVAPPGFDFPEQSQVWAPIAMTPAALADRSAASLTVVGRLRQDVTRATAAAAVSLVGADLARAYPKQNGDTSMHAMSFLEGMADPGTPEITKMINVAALIVLLIGSANVANLLLARGSDRQREIAVRLALGGGRVRIVRQLLAESVVLGLAAVPVSLGLASIVLRALRNAMPAQTVKFIAGWDRLGVDGTVIGFTIAGALAAAVLFGLFPALQISKPAIVSALREGGRSIAGGRSRHRIRRALVIAEFALALPLLVATALAASGAYGVSHGPQGYEPSGLISLQTSLSSTPYQDARTRRQFAERLVTETMRLPGVRSAATVNLLPNAPGNTSRLLEIEGHPSDPHRPQSATYRITSPAYFETMRIAVTKGRAFSDLDRDGSLPVAIVSESMARAMWPGENPIGRRVKALGDDQDPGWRTVVGVSGDIIDDWFNRRYTPTLYIPMAQRPTFTVTLVARTNGDPAAFGPALRRALAAADPDQPPTALATMTQSLHDRTAGLQIVSALMGGLGCLALVLATIGIYSLLAYEVSQRAHEIGVRMALGATRGDVVRSIVGHALRLAGIGLGLGVLLALPTQHVVVSVLFNVVAFSPLLLAALVLVLGATAVVASAVPARSASRMSPGAALRAN